MSDLDLETRADSLFAAAAANDWDGFRAHFADVALLFQNVAGPRSIDEAMITMPDYTADGTTLRYENRRKFVGEDSVTEMHDTVFTKPDGVKIRINMCVVMQFDDDGLIKRADEYLDSAAAAGLIE